VAVELLDRSLAARGELHQPLKVAAVALQCVIREASFDAQMRQITVDEIVGG
jgi:hypothetical protein